MDTLQTKMASAPQRMLSKVPEVTIFFWIIKVLCTTTGETASDFLNVNLGLGLTYTSLVMGALLALALFFQLKQTRYIPGIYWLAVVLISIFGTLVTDNMTDAMHIPLEASTILFSALLAATFLVWYLSEKSLSIHSIYTVRREVFYWLAILFTFALGTAAGDLMAESMAIGYAQTGLIICAVIAVTTLAWRFFSLDSVLAFWVVYIMTRPLGASFGDYLSQAKQYGGLGLGATETSLIFLAAILGTVAFLAISKEDQIAPSFVETPTKAGSARAMRQVAAVVCIALLVSVGGYSWRQAALTSSEASAPASSLGDLSAFTAVEKDTLRLVEQGDLAGAKTRIKDLETSWDSAEAGLKPKNPAKWKEIDGTIDAALTQLRAQSPTTAGCKDALEHALAVMKTGA